MARIIIDIPDSIGAYAKTNKKDAPFYRPYEIRTIWEAISNGTILSNNVTNGDVMNALFPTENYEAERHWMGSEVCLSDEWWNTSYKEQINGME